ncbi:general substrate transporter, partial [Neohortaea acidophila]
DDSTAANAPLLADPSDGQDTRTRRTRSTQTKITLRTAGKTVWLLTCTAGISGLLFGYDTGVISSTLVSIRSDLSGRALTTADKSLVTAATSLFALLSAPTTGIFADKYGRRSVIVIASTLFIIGALVQAVATYVWIMVVGRAVVGAAIGLASAATPLYITELSPAELRGRLVTIQSLFITGAQVIAYLAGWGLASVPAGWRWMVGLGAAPAIAQLFLLGLLYETPRWLVKNGRTERARTVLHKVYGGLTEQEGREAAVENVLVDIQDEIATEAKLGLDDSSTTTLQTTFKSLTTRPPHRRALTIACMLHALQQLCGFNSLMYFSATIFALVGFVYPIGTSLTVAGTNFLFTIAAFAFIDTVGRRNMLLFSIPFMVIGLGVCSFSFSFMDVWRGSSIPAPGVNAADSTPWSGVLIAAMMLYVAAYATGLGCVPWQQSELFPLQVRSLGSGIATAANWSSNFIIGVSFLPLMEWLGATVTFALYAAICAVGWGVVWMIYPETAGLELEGARELLEDGFGVKKSVERFKAGKKR